MPNLRPPVLTTADALRYRERIVAACPPTADFNPLMTLYLTDKTSEVEIREAAASRYVRGVKLYPAGATTHSEA
jgi:dihydroorotase